MYIVGCDGGATKAEYVIADKAGHIVAHLKTPGIQYALLGENGFAEALYKDLDALFAQAGIKKELVTCAVFGMTNYGETQNSQKDMTSVAQAYFKSTPTLMMNDAVIGWSGSLGGKPGINVVAGTGSIAYGQDEAGTGCRAGGYCVRFTDEGSCTWMGAKTAALFFKQLDGRLPRAALYDVVMEEYGFDDPMQFIDFLYAGPSEDDAALAAIQILAAKAYKKGDPSIEQLYAEAAEELAALVRTIANQLNFKQLPIHVSYSGGLFQAGDCIMNPFKRAVENAGGQIEKPLYSPIVGSIIYGLLHLGMQSEIHIIAEALAKQLS